MYLFCDYGVMFLWEVVLGGGLGVEGFMGRCFTKCKKTASQNGNGFIDFV